MGLGELEGELLEALSCSYSGLHEQSETLTTHPCVNRGGRYLGQGRFNRVEAMSRTSFLEAEVDIILGAVVGDGHRNSVGRFRVAVGIVPPLRFEVIVQSHQEVVAVLQTGELVGAGAGRAHIVVETVVVGLGVIPLAVGTLDPQLHRGSHDGIGVLVQYQAKDLPVTASGGVHRHGEKPRAIGAVHLSGAGVYRTAADRVIDSDHAGALGLGRDGSVYRKTHLEHRVVGFLTVHRGELHLELTGCLCVHGVVPR